MKQTIYLDLLHVMNNLLEKIYKKMIYTILIY